MKQKCGSIRELLGAYADKELDQARADQVVRHLETCADCRRELDQILELSRLAKSVEHPRLADDYWDWQRTRVWRGLRERKRALTPSYRPLFVWPKLAAAAAGFVVVLVVVLAGWRTLMPRRGPIGPVGELPSVLKRDAEKPVAAAPVAGRSAESEEAGKAAVGTSAEAEGRSDELARAPAAAARDAEKAKVGYAAKGAGATGATSTSKPSPAPVRGIAPRMKVAAEEPREDLYAAPSVSGQHVRVSSDKQKGRIVSGPVLLESPPLADADALDTGTVLLNVKTDSAGRVLSAAVRRSSGSARLDSVAVRQIRQSRFKATVKNNRRVASSFEYPFRVQKNPVRSAEIEKPPAGEASPGTRQYKRKDKQPGKQSDDDSDKPKVKQPDRQPDDHSDKPEVKQPDKQPDKRDGNQEDKQSSTQEGGQSDTPEDSQPNRSLKEKTKK